MTRQEVTTRDRTPEPALVPTTGSAKTQGVIPPTMAGTPRTRVIAKRMAAPTMVVTPAMTRVKTTATAATTVRRPTAIVR
jgi:hypothetical protein